MLRHVYLTSFFLSHCLPPGVEPMSVAVYQPRGFNYPKVAWADIRPDGEHWIRPRDFISQPDPLKAYHDALFALYESRIEAARYWANTLQNDVALCCWCPNDRAARRQIEQFGSFVCHTAVLSEFIFRRLGLAVWEDGDRRHMAVLGQKVSHAA